MAERARGAGEAVPPGGEGLKHELSLQPLPNTASVTGGCPPACTGGNSKVGPHLSPLRLPHILPEKDPLPGLAWSTLD